jgi:hypothetical protein
MAAAAVPLARRTQYGAANRRSFRVWERGWRWLARQARLQGGTGGGRRRRTGRAPTAACCPVSATRFSGRGEQKSCGTGACGGANYYARVQLVEVREVLREQHGQLCEHACARGLVPAARDCAWRSWARGQSSRPPWVRRTTVRGAMSPRSRTGPQRTAQGRPYAGARHARC